MFVGKFPFAIRRFKASGCWHRVQGCAGDRNVENVENVVIKQQRVGKGEEERKGSLLSGIERPLPIGDNAVQTDLNIYPVVLETGV